MALGPLPARTSATSAAERALKAAIVGGELAPGERLPPERELAERFGISRLTLRAALATLAAAGLVTVRQGSGYTVRDVRESGGADLLPELIDRAAARKGLAAAAADLLRLRRYLAGAVLEALAEHPPSAAARRAIDGAVERFARAVAAGDAEAIPDADLAVVRALLDATGSMILRVCLNPIMAVLRGSPPLRAALYGEPATNLLGWRALAAWATRPDPRAIATLLAVLADHDRASIDRLRRGRPR
ncbi:MAG TPA: GntR family transcriptional regulator [Kofleriaceae bacterium]|nr:GntR family transcriptional regulator [Kofleriaceae bacterium]